MEIVDEKLDLYMSRKAAEGRMSHLLIDRFRFDSFAVDAAADRPGQLLTRFGHTIYLQFMVTPPEATVERAWKRGQEFGRYKAVEDLLAHNVEAFAGIPRLFFLWALRRDKVVAFEFLDNTVPNGEVPRTIAFGGNDAMIVLDPVALLDIERFRKINVYAETPAQVYAGIDHAPDRNVGFLKACLGRLGEVRFASAAPGASTRASRAAGWSPATARPSTVSARTPRCGPPARPSACSTGGRGRDRPRQAAGHGRTHPRLGRAARHGAGLVPVLPCTICMCEIGILHLVYNTAGSISGYRSAP